MTKSESEYAFETRLIHAGEAPDPATGAHGVPIYASTTYAFRSAEQVASFEMGEIPHYVYSRYGNPTVRCFELKMADLEGAEMATAAASGMAAITATLLQVIRHGDHLVASSDLYGVSNELIETDLRAQGATVTRVDCRDLAAVEAAVTDQTRAIFVESLSNPRLRVADIPALAEIARRASVLLIVDNTFLSPVLLRPLEYGADIVIHSATKYLSGTGQLLGGVVSGRKTLVVPIAERLARHGGSLTPFAAWQLLTGVKTLALRMERQSATAAKVAAFLAAHPAVASVSFPTVSSDPGVGTMAALTGDRFGGVLSFTLHGGVAATHQCLNRLRLCTIAVSLGDTSTLVWPFEMDDAGLIRVAVGLEDANDLVADFATALEPETMSRCAEQMSGAR